MAGSREPERTHTKPELRAADIYEVVIKYRDKGTGVPLQVSFNPSEHGRIDGVIWNSDQLEKLRGKTGEERKKAAPGQLPNPKFASAKSDDKADADDHHEAIRGVPEATCCYINGRWICWD